MRPGAGSTPFRRISNVLAAIAMLAVNWLANALPSAAAPRARWLLAILSSSNLTFQIYLAWVVVATVVNVTVGFYELGFPSRMVEEIWTVAWLVTIAVLGLGMLLRRGDAAFNLVLVWALVAIAVARTYAPAVAITAGAAAGMLALALVAHAGRRWPTWRSA